MKFSFFASTSLNIFTIYIHFQVFLIIPCENSINDKKNETKLNTISSTRSELLHFQKSFCLLFSLLLRRPGQRTDKEVV